MTENSANNSKLNLLVNRRARALGATSFERLYQFARDPKTSVNERNEAISLIGLLSYLRRLKPVEDRAAARLFVDILWNADRVTAWTVSVALSQLSSVPLVSLGLIEVIRELNDTEVRRAAVHALGFVEGKRCAALLSEIIFKETEPTKLRVEAAEALVTCAPKSIAISVLRKTLRSDSKSIKAAARRGLMFLEAGVPRK